MVRLRKLIRSVSKVIKACASTLIAVGLDLMRFAERLEKRSTSK